MITWRLYHREVWQAPCLSHWQAADMQSAPVATSIGHQQAAVVQASPFSLVTYALWCMV